MSSTIRLEQSQVNSLYYHVVGVQVVGQMPRGVTVRLQVDDGGYDGLLRNEVREKIVEQCNKAEEYRKALEEIARTDFDNLSPGEDLARCQRLAWKALGKE